ncbi:MAG: trigger factor [Candidatus Delongbacteria bacterium]|jgi:trigger factor|nr:trigger factor [Candidatus Delongbacteria bacterium]
MKTESTVEKGYSLIINFELSADELKEYKDVAFKKFRSTAKVDGFRKGKVPASIIKTRYTANIEIDAINEAINTSYSNYLQENKIYPLADPVIEDIDQKDEALKFSAKIEINPEFELLDYTGMEIEYTKVNVTDEEIEQEIGKLLDKHASQKETVEPIKKGSIVDIKIKPTGDENAEWETKTIEVGITNDQIDQELEGMTKGETKTVKFNLPEQPDQSLNFDVMADKVYDKILPELNDEFAKTYDKKYKTLEDLRKAVKEDVTKSKTNQNENAIYDKFAKNIIDKHESFEVPPSILDGYLNNLVDNAIKQYGPGMDRKMLEGIYKENAAVSLKWEYIRRKIIEKENITVEDTDIDEKYKKITEESSIDIEKVKQYYSPKEKQQMLRDDILDKKVRNFIKANNKVKLVDEIKEEVDNKSAEETTEEKK